MKSPIPPTHMRIADLEKIPRSVRVQCDRLKNIKIINVISAMAATDKCNLLLVSLRPPPLLLLL